MKSSGATNDCIATLLTQGSHSDLAYQPTCMVATSTFVKSVCQVTAFSKPLFQWSPTTYSVAHFRQADRFRLPSLPNRLCGGEAPLSWSRQTGSPSTAFSAVTTYSVGVSLLTQGIRSDLAYQPTCMVATSTFVKNVCQVTAFSKPLFQWAPSAYSAENYQKLNISSRDLF